MLPEILGYLVAVALCTVFLIRKKKLYSGAVLSLATIMLAYIAFVTGYKNHMVLTTIRWPLPDIELAEASEIVFWFAITFFITCFLIHFFPSRKKRPLPDNSEPFSRKKGKNAFFAATFIGITLLIATADAWWIFYPYPEGGKKWAVIDLGGTGFIVQLAVLYGFRDGLTLGGGYRRAAMLIVVLVCSHFVLTGDRGSLLFLLLGTLLIYYLNTDEKKRRRMKWSAIPGFPLLIYFLDQISKWRSWGNSTEISGVADLASDIDLLPQALAHLNHSATIFEFYGAHFDGIFSFFSQFFMQILPTAVLNHLNIEIYSGAWALADYVQHGGGFFVPAETYFIGGYVGVISIASYFSLFSAWNDRILSVVFREGVDRALTRGEVVLASLSLGALPYTFFYGLQAFHRMLLLPALFVVVTTIARKLSASTARS